MGASDWAGMVPSSYHDFLVASTQASAALIGLLFVSISIAPHRVFGGRAEAVRQSQALSAFTALANIFFISFSSLIPGAVLGPIVTGIGCLAAIQTLSLLRLAPHWRQEGALRRGVLLFVVSAVIYAAEIEIGAQLWLRPSDSAVLTGLLEALLGAYAIGLSRAWELLGAPRAAFGSMLANALQGTRRRASETPARQPTEAPDPPDLVL